MNRVFITGLGCITSIGNDTAEVEQSLRDARHGFVRYAPFDRAEVPVKVAAPVRGFLTEGDDPEDWTWPARYSFRREQVRSLSPNALYATCAFEQAVADARLTPADVSNEDTGLYAASCGSPGMMSRHLDRVHRLGAMKASAMGIVSSIAGTVQFNLVAHYKIKGASTGFASACASSAHAFGFAADEIALGRQKRMFVVGAEDGNADTILPFASMRALSPNPDPESASRPFDAKRDGFVGTGGATVLVLESEAEVLRRGVTPYAEALGWGQASDGHHVAMSHPEGEGLRNAMNRALKSAAISPADVDYINAHATSTPVGDIAECRALRAVLGEHAPRIAVSSTKSLTGHGCSLAGAMETAFCALSLRHGFLPGSAHITALDAACEGLNIIRQTQTVSPSIVLNNSCGFGGANVCLVLKRAT